MKYFTNDYMIGLNNDKICDLIENESLKNEIDYDFKNTLSQQDQKLIKPNYCYKSCREICVLLDDSIYCEGFVLTKENNNYVHHAWLMKDNEIKELIFTKRLEYSYYFKTLEISSERLKKLRYTNKYEYSTKIRFCGYTSIVQNKLYIATGIKHFKNRFCHINIIAQLFNHNNNILL